MELNHVTETKPRFSNRDLLVVAVLSGIGGVMSSYVSYLGNLLNKVFGVPFGAGQFVSGLHVFWIIIAAGLVRKPGAGVAAGVLKGFIEFLAGSPHGITIVIVSLVQGLVVDIVLWFFRSYTLTSLATAGAIAAASNVIVFQLLYFSGAPFIYIAAIAGVAAISGILLAGSFGYSILNIIIQARPFRMGINDLPANGNKRWVMWISGLLFLVFASGSVYYYSAVYEPPWVGPQGLVSGQVDKELNFRLSDFKYAETTIHAELIGKVTHVPEQEYTGIPVRVILEKAKPLSTASKLKVVATDGYSVEFNLEDVWQDDKLILQEEEDTLRLIAGNYEGGYWVRKVSKLVVE